jgi:3-oxoacyl-[acyl-carrier protein] reductase
MKGYTSNSLVMIVGAAHGIGYSTALNALKRNYQIILVDKDEQGLIEAKKNLDPFSNHPIHMYVADITNYNSLENLFKDIEKKSLIIDKFFNSVGISHDLTLFHKIDSNVIEKVIDVNIKGIIKLLQLQLNYLKKIKLNKASIVNSSSVSAKIGATGLSIYAMTKAATECLSKSLAREYGSMGIRVNSITPGFTETRMLSGLLMQNKKIEDHIKQQSKLGRSATADEVSNAVLFLLSDESSHITGTEIIVDGGYSLT